MYPTIPAGEYGYLPGYDEPQFVVSSIVEANGDVWYTIFEDDGTERAVLVNEQTLAAWIAYVSSQEP